MIQGSSIAFFREDDAWILVDYKSDRLETADAFRSRYAVQGLALYKLAVEQITHRPVEETHIYSLHLQQEITTINRKEVFSAGVFDVVGPVMIGPSSSHTAGAARIGLMAREIPER